MCSTTCRVAARVPVPLYRRRWRCASSGGSTNVSAGVSCARGNVEAAPIPLPTPTGRCDWRIRCCQLRHISCSQEAGGVARFQPCSTATITVGGSSASKCCTKLIVCATTSVARSGFVQPCTINVPAQCVAHARISGQHGCSATSGACNPIRKPRARAASMAASHAAQAFAANRGGSCTSTALMPRLRSRSR